MAKKLNYAFFIGAIIIPSALPSLASAAETLSIFNNSVYTFRDIRGVNDFGGASGDLFEFGADLTSNSLGVQLTLTYPPTSFTASPAPCAPALEDPGHCNTIFPFDPTKLAAPWTLTFSKPGATSLTVNSRSTTNLNATVPLFPTSVVLSKGATPTTPTISWKLGDNYVPDSFRVSIKDKSRLRVDGIPETIYDINLNPQATSFTFPSFLDDGIQLQLGGHYTIQFQVHETRDNLPFRGNNNQLLARSTSYFAFTPVASNQASDIFLPIVGSDPNPNDNLGAPYQFDLAYLDRTRAVFIDPLIATGYDYAIGVGNPNFASVILPNVGDGLFTVSYLSGGSLLTESVHESDQFFFPAGGVSAFSVRGIEVSAGLDPIDVTAFVTGLTFVTEGNFTGTMTPVLTLIAAVPEPQTYAMLLAGLGLLGFAVRRKKLA